MILILEVAQSGHVCHPQLRHSVENSRLFQTPLRFLPTHAVLMETEKNSNRELFNI